MNRRDLLRAAACLPGLGFLAPALAGAGPPSVDVGAATARDPFPTIRLLQELVDACMQATNCRPWRLHLANNSEAVRRYVLELCDLAGWEALDPSAPVSFRGIMVVASSAGPCAEWRRRLGEWDRVVWVSPPCDGLPGLPRGEYVKAGALWPTDMFPWDRPHE